MRTCQAFPLYHCPPQDTLQRGLWRHSAHICECNANERSQFNSPFLGAEQVIITTTLFWVLVGGTISNLKLLSWISYSDFWWATGTTKTERRYFNSWKVLEISTQYNSYLESELISCHGCALEAQCLYIRKQLWDWLFKGKERTRQCPQGEWWTWHTFPPSNYRSACSTCYSVVKLPSRLSVLPKMVSFLEVSVFVICLIGELG